MTFAVVACPYCRRAKTFEVGRKTTQCAHCMKTLKLEHLKVFHRSDDLAEVQRAAGELNARYSGLGATQEFHRAMEAAEEARGAAPDDRGDPWAPVVRAARVQSAEVPRADAIARALTERDGDWDDDLLAEAFAMAGLKPEKAEPHLKRMLATNVVYEPRPGRYRAV